MGKTQEVKDSDLNDDDRRTNALHKAIMKFAGGFWGLLGRSFDIGREDENVMATPEATDLRYRLFDLEDQARDMPPTISANFSTTQNKESRPRNI